MTKEVRKRKKAWGIEYGMWTIENNKQDMMIENHIGKIFLNLLNKKPRKKYSSALA